MRNQNHIRLDFFDLNVSRKRIGSNERIKQKPRPSGFDEKTGMSKAGEFHSAPQPSTSPNPMPSADHCEFFTPKE
jgi:hypothetical protein